MRFRKLKQQTKQTKEPEQRYIYASYPLKVKAFIVDMFMIYAPILYIITYAFMDGKDEFQSSQLAPLIGVSIYGLIYSTLLAKNGQTPGKKAYDIKVVDDKSFENISFLRAIMRFIAFLFSATILIGLLVPFYRKDKKALHDVLCSTIEIVTEE
ncbi:RDD family protein [Sulfurimonas aquatica]|uniref:RDD family protein n=1 Tax=Sulfurimonas aquatica TaxID=2672570 RepID=A0A975GDN4_9BACT|nr:RDD family protein [Sulfurimonas aquatica]QSZ42772.1 RDD family protein [Sulfurimonas aquatica]